MRASFGHGHGAGNGFGGPGGAFGGNNAPKCYHCGRPGHIARMCPQARTLGGFGGGGRGGAFPPRPRAAANPDGTPVKCYRCNGENHLARDCLAPRDDSAKKCYKCNETGHIAR